MLLEKIEDLLKEVDSLKAQNAEDVDKLRLKYLSKKGEINALMADFRNVAADQKKAVGIKINELKKNAQEKIASRFRPRKPMERNSTSHVRLIPSTWVRVIRCRL